jgi:prepilin-type N-terminal cleavage/methylation domain-containing protein
VKKHLSNRLANAGPRHPRWRQAARAPERGRAVSTAAGFTLTEILIAIALILIIGSLAVANMMQIGITVDHEPPPKVLKASIRQARFMALQRMSAVMLTYNGDNHSFDILDDQGNVLEQDNDGLDSPDDKLTLKFLAVEPGTDLGADVNPKEDDAVTYVSEDLAQKRLLFHPSGACAPVKVELTINDQDENKTVYRLDPFSEGPPPQPPADTPMLQ